MGSIGAIEWKCCKECTPRQDQTSNPNDCPCNVCQRPDEGPLTNNIQIATATRISQCESCEYADFCKFFLEPHNITEDGLCRNHKPFQSIEQRRMEMVWAEVEKHGEIYHLVGLDKLAMEGRLLVTPPHDFSKLSAELQKLYGWPGTFTIADYNALFKQVSNLYCLIKNLPQILCDLPTVKAEFESIAPENWDLLIQTACEVMLSGAKSLAVKNQVDKNTCVNPLL